MARRRVRRRTVAPPNKELLLPAHKLYGDSRKRSLAHLSERQQNSESLDSAPALQVQSDGDAPRRQALGDTRGLSAYRLNRNQALDPGHRRCLLAFVLQHGRDYCLDGQSGWVRHAR